MASPVPAKSQPLHNFDLPRTLKWNKHANSNTNHHRRRSIKSPNNPSPARDSSNGYDSVTRSPTRNDSVIESNNLGFVKSERVGKKVKDSVETKKSSKILIKIGSSKNSSNDNDNDNEESCEIVKREVFEETEEVKNDEFVDEEAKTWNLRPRKPIRKSLNVNGTGITVKNNNINNVVEKIGKAQSPLKNTNKLGENDGEKEKMRHSVDVSLTKEEIEEDIYAITGVKPSRRPKKRPKQVQKQVDFVFPGLWLMSITPDSYKVSENSMKG